MLAIFQFPFMQNALAAGSMVAVVAAVLGYFLVVRGLSFAGHALSSIGFAGAAGAVLLGVPPLLGVMVFTVAAAAAISVLGREIRERDVATGVIMTFALGLGLLFLSLYHGYAEQAYSILFGTIVGVSLEDVVFICVVGLILLGLIAVLGRPLLFSSFDMELAEMRGVPVRVLGVVFLILVALTVAITTQVVGVLLVYALLIGPPATAICLVHQPARAVILSIMLGLAYTWLGIFLGGNSPWPVSFFITALSFGMYLPVRLLSRGKDSKGLPTSVLDPAAGSPTRQP